MYQAGLCHCMSTLFDGDIVIWAAFKFQFHIHFFAFEFSLNFESLNIYMIQILRQHF